MTPERISYFPGISKQMCSCHFKLLICEADLQHLYHYRPGCSFLLMPSDTIFFFFFFFSLSWKSINQSLTQQIVYLHYFCTGGSNPLKSDFFFLIMWVALQLWFLANNTTAESHIFPLFPSSGNSFSLLLLSTNVFWVILFCWQVWPLP